MKERPFRVVVASEYPEIRHMLAGVAEHEPGAVVVGTAENSLKALALVRRLRPEIALVDSDLPYVAGVDSVRMSRMSGLDTALNISRENPAFAVVVSNLKAGSQSVQSGTGDPTLWVYGDSGSSRLPVRLRDLIGGSHASMGLAYGGISFSEKKSEALKLTRIIDKTVMSGGFAIMGGLGLMVTIMLAGAGVILAAAGACVLVLGLLGKLGASWWYRRNSRR